MSYKAVMINQIHILVTMNEYTKVTINGHNNELNKESCHI